MKKVGSNRVCSKALLSSVHSFSKTISRVAYQSRRNQFKRCPRADSKTQCNIPRLQWPLSPKTPMFKKYLFIPTLYCKSRLIVIIRHQRLFVHCSVQVSSAKQGFLPVLCVVVAGFVCCCGCCLARWHLLLREYTALNIVVRSFPRSGSCRS